LKRFEDVQKKIFEKINQIILTDDGVPDILSRIKQTRNLIYAGEMHLKGAMYNIINPQLLASRTDITGKEDSPPRSEDTYGSKSKARSSLIKRTTITNKDNEIEQLKMVKHKSSQQKINLNFQTKDSQKMEIASDYATHDKNSYKRMSSKAGNSPVRDLNNSQNEGYSNGFIEEIDSENSIYQPNAGSSSHLKPIGSFNNVIVNEADDEYSDREVESYLFGYSGKGDEYVPPRIESMGQADITRYLVGYIKIKDKKKRYEIQQQKELFQAHIDGLNQRIDYAEKEGKEYNMILHTELEQFISNKKKEFYQKFKDIVNLKEQHGAILNSMDEYSKTIKQM
jgi:hypothetical protein